VVLGADEHLTTVTNTPVWEGKKMDEDLDKQLKPLPSILRDSVIQRERESDTFLRSIEEANERVSAIPKEKLLDEIMSRMEAQAVGKGSLLSMEQIDAIGLALIENYCDFETTAKEFRMPVHKLKYLIRELDELQVYYEIAQEGIKSLTDHKVIQLLKSGDPDIIKMVYGRMYAGRSKGGFNASELGTMGYNDKLGKKLAQETADDRKANKVEVQFNFFKKEVRTEFEQVQIEGNVVEGEEVKDEE
jgi:hypothetical protein